MLVALWWLVACGGSSHSPVPETPPSATPSVASLQSAVYTLADPALDGRDEGSPGSAKARAWIHVQLERRPATDVLGRLSTLLADEWSPGHVRVAASAHKLMITGTPGTVPPTCIRSFT